MPPFTMMQIWLVGTVSAYIGVYLLLRVVYPDEEMMSDADLEPTPGDPQSIPEDQSNLTPESSED